MYFISGGIGFIACIIFIILIVIFALRGKPCRTPLIALFLSVLLFLGSGFLYSRTDPDVGGAGFLRYIIQDRTVPPDLWGEWRDFASGKDSDSFHGIYIYGNTIEIYWVTEGGLSTSLYWAGTFQAPPDGKEPYTWESTCDEDRTSAAQLASNEMTKTFTYSNGVLSYEANILGVRTTIEARKQPWFLESEEGEESSAALQTPTAATPQTPVITPQTATDNTPAQTAISGTLGDYDVEIKDAVLTTDSDGNPAIVVTYNWTNNSSETTSAMAKILEKAFQNGVQMKSALILNPDIYDPEESWLSVQPGGSLDVRCAYTLWNDKQDVEFELAEAFSASGDTVVQKYTLSDLSQVENLYTPEAEPEE